MIVTWTFLAVILSIGLVFLGVKMASSVKQGDIKIFFIVMYFITLLTFFNLGTSAYFYAKTIKKRGQKGPRGLQGNVGERGDSGYCESTCKENSIKHMIINKIKESPNTDISITNKDNVENKICRFFSNISISNEEGEKINNLTFNNYKNIMTNFGNSLTFGLDNENLNNILSALNSDGSINNDSVGKPLITKNDKGEYTLVSNSKPVSIILNDNSEDITLKYSEDPCA